MINKCNNHLDFFLHPYPDLDGDPDPYLKRDVKPVVSKNGPLIRT